MVKCVRDPPSLHSNASISHPDRAAHRLSLRSADCACSPRSSPQKSYDAAESTSACTTGAPSTHPLMDPSDGSDGSPFGLGFPLVRSHRHQKRTMNRGPVKPVAQHVVKDVMVRRSLLSHVSVSPCPPQPCAGGCAQVSPCRTGADSADSVAAPPLDCARRGSQGVQRESPASAASAASSRYTLPS